MGVIKYIESKRDFDYVDEYPDFCPLCQKSIIPKYIFMYRKWDRIHELLCKCPNDECNSLFFVVYKKSSIRLRGGDGFRYKKSNFYPMTKIYKNFPQEINEFNSEFIRIYNQAHHAEQEGLDLICGGAYRKALEFLVKDFIIYENPDEAETVKKTHSIQQCINNYIDSPDIKEMAERAAWLGNDETHYIRKWDTKDIDDLKNLIDLTVYFIAMKVKSKRYRDEMK